MRSEGAEGSSSTSDCDDPLVVIACAAESDACPAACRENSQEEEDNEIVKSGSLVVKSSAADDRSVVVSTAAKAVSDLDTLTFKTSEEVTLTKVVLEKYGYSSATNLVSQVWLEDEDGNQITSKATPNAKGLVNLTMKKDYKVVDGILNATIVVETNQSATVWWTLWFKVTEVVSTAKDVDLGDYKAYTYDVVSYNGTQAKVTAKWGTKEYNYEAGESYEVSKFKVKAPDDSAIKISGFTLTDAGNLKIYDYFDEIEVLVAGEAVKATTNVNKDEELTVSFKNAVEIAAKASTEFVVNVTLNDEFDEYGKNVVLSLKNVSDLSATDKNNARITVDKSAANWLTYTFLGGKVRLTNTKLGNVEAAVNSTDILIASGEISVGEAIEGSVTVTFGGASFTNAASATLYPAEAIEAIRLVISGEEYDGVITNASSTSATATFSNVEVSESGKVRLYVDIKDDADYEGKVLTFSSLTWGNDLEYSDGDTPASWVDVSGSISVSKLTLNAAGGSLVNNLSSSNDIEYKNGEVNKLVIFDGTYTAKKGDIYLNEFKVTGGDLSALNAKTKITFYLSLDGDEVADAKASLANPSVASDSFSNVLVKDGESVKVVLEAEIDSAETAVKDLGKFLLALDGEDVNGNVAGHAERNSAAVSLVNLGSIQVDAGNSQKTVLRKAADAQLAKFTVKPDGASEVTLEEIHFTLQKDSATVPDQSDVKIYIDGSEEDLSYVGDVYTVELNKSVKSEGVEVIIEYADDVAGVFTVTDLYVNNNSFASKTFSRKFVDALVWINNQEDDGAGANTYYFGVDKKSSDEITQLAICTSQTNCANEADWISINGWNAISNGDHDEVLNSANTTYYITGVRYMINYTAGSSANCSEWTVNGTACDGVTSLYTAATPAEVTFTVTANTDITAAAAAGSASLVAWWNYKNAVDTTTTSVVLVQSTAAAYTYDANDFDTNYTTLTAGSVTTAYAAASCSEWTINGTACDGVTSLYTAAVPATQYTKILRSEYNDFFKLGSTYARLNKATD